MTSLYLPRFVILSVYAALLFSYDFFATSSTLYAMGVWPLRLTVGLYE
jgi:hypothetical protein